MLECLKKYRALFTPLIIATRNKLYSFGKLRSTRLLTIRVKHVDEDVRTFNYNSAVVGTILKSYMQVLFAKLKDV